MRSRIIRRRVLIVMIYIALGLMTVNSFAQFGGGDGSEANPWAIETAEHLNSIRNYQGVAHNDKHYIIRADIDLGVAPWNTGQGWTPIGPTVANGFYGHLNGNGHVIKNLTIDRSASNYQGLFGYTSGTSSIRDLGLLNVNIIGNNYVSGLVAYIDDTGRVERCFVTGRVQGATYVGGISGQKGSNTNESSFLYDCYTNVHVIATAGTETTYAGGIVGYQYRGETHRCYATGLVELPVISNNAAAVVGRRGGGNVSNLYWNRDTVGQTEGVSNQAGVYPGSTTSQLLQSATYAGFNFNNVWNIAAGNSYAYLRWQGEEPGEHNIPRLLPPRNITFTVGTGFINLAWQAPPIEAGVPDGYNVYRNRERVNEQLIEALQYRDEDVDNWVTYTYYLTAVYEDEESNPSASLTATPVNFAGGDGTAESPYLIATASHLDGVRYVRNKHFRQTANINLGEAPWNEGQGWEPIANNTNPFTGTYNGDGFLIEGLTINRNATYQSLFGYGNGATVTDVRLEDVDVIGSYYTGALFGYTTNTAIKDSYAKGSVVGTYYLGGLIGYTAGGSITGCYIAGEVVVTGTSVNGYIGGIAGYFTSNTNMTNCYSTAMVQGNQTRIGGLIGWKNGIINNSYCSGAVIAIDETEFVGGLVGQNSAGAINNSFWNTETTGRDTSPGGGTGTGTSQMVRRGTYTDANWEFPDVWNIVEGETYPFLSWEDGPSFHNKPGPSGLVADGDYEALEIALEWDMIGNPNRYNVYRNNVLLTSVNHPTREWLDRNVELFVDYTYYVKAVFVEGEEEQISAPSNPVNIILHQPFAGGDGTENSPYQVANENQLNMIRYLLNSHYIQTANLDLHRAAWAPIGNNNTRFRGSYNGNGFRITDMNINTTTAYQGLFGYAEGATLRNIILEDVNLRMGQYSGALVGYSSSTNISNVEVTGAIQGTSTNVGGIAGYALSANYTINNCSVSGTLTSTSNNIGGILGSGYVTINDCTTNLEITTSGIYAGGIVGYTASTMRINRCAVLGNITSSSTTANIFLGGILGRSYLTYIEDSYVTGNVTSSAQGGRDYVGGLFGATYSTTYTILRCYTTGNVTGRDHVGGLLGTMVSTTAGNIEDCYTMGTITGVNYVGGLIGSNQTDKSVLRCYSTGRIFGQTNVGGLIGSGNGTTTNSYWNTVTSGVEESPGGGLPRDGRHMRYPYTEDTYVGWNFNTVWAHDVDPSWNGGYPRLHWQERPTEFIETPLLKTDIVQIGGADHFRIRWELVDGARSYKIYASDNPYTTDWGEPVRIVGEDVAIYTEPIGNNIERYFHIIASSRTAR